MMCNNLSLPYLASIARIRFLVAEVEFLVIIRLQYLVEFVTKDKVLGC